MTVVAIPAWNAQGVIPPIDELDPTSAERPPYTVSLTDFVSRFGTSPERCGILRGFLEYRRALQNAGLNDGFQWINGSFLENTESLERRAPQDIDVVTFLHTPSDLDMTEKTLRLFDHDEVKNRFKVDAYFVELDALTPRELTFWSAYWYSLWSHRRNQLWKGFVQIELAPADESELLMAIPDGAMSVSPIPTVLP
jgi:hypothetical protein